MRRPIIFEAPDNRCFGCGPNNPAGLGLQFVETDEGVEVEHVVPEHLAGAPGVVHGGIQATMLDETMCMTAYAKCGMPAVTGELTVRYLHPVPTVTAIVVRGRITERRADSAFIEAVISLAATGQELTRATGRFFAQRAPRP
jgi:uncharacterized protein (TIGR00369 family)